MTPRLKMRPMASLMLVSILSLVLGGCTLVLPLVAPFQNLPAPTGEYQVGTRTVCWVDSSRDEVFTPEPDHRRLVVQVWYPSLANSAGRLYIDDPDKRIPALSKQLRLPRSTIAHVNKVRSHAGDGLTASDASIPFPVLIFSHGLSGMRFQNTALVEDLASHGYIILAMDHSYDANIAIFDDHEVAEYRSGKRRGLRGHLLENIDLQQLDHRVADVRFTLEQLSRAPELDLLKDLPVDLERIGLIGHSAGGTTVVTTQALDKRIKATFVLDGWYIPVPDTILAKGCRTPLLNLGQNEWRDPDNYDRMDLMLANSSGPFYNLYLPNTQHTDFTDMPLFSSFSRLIGYTAARDPLALNTLIRQTARHFFDVHLKESPQSELTTYLNRLTGLTVSCFTP